MFRSEYGYLLPRYNRTRSSNNVAQYYDGVDGRDSASEEFSRKYVENFQALKLQPDSSTSSAEESSDSEESVSSSNEEITEAHAISLREQFSALLSQFPAHTVYLKAAAYQAGIFQPSKSVAYDPQINSFFLVMDDVDASKLPDKITSFCKELKNIGQIKQPEAANNI